MRKDETKTAFGRIRELKFENFQENSKFTYTLRMILHVDDRHESDAVEKASDQSYADGSEHFDSLIASWS